jgi:hypothetical protein
MTLVDNRKAKIVLELIIQLAKDPPEGVAILVTTYIMLCDTFRMDQPPRQQIADEISHMVATAETARGGLQ